MQLGNYLVLGAVTIYLGTAVNNLWFIVSCFMVCVMGFAIYANNQARRKERIKELREQRQLSLGVPPEEIGL